MTAYKIDLTREEARAAGGDDLGHLAGYRLLIAEDYARAVVESSLDGDTHRQPCPLEFAAELLHGALKIGRYVYRAPSGSAAAREIRRIVERGAVHPDEGYARAVGL